MLFRKGNLSMLFGEPGSHKTRIMLNAVVNMAVPTMAFSTDSDQDTVASRLLAMATKTPTDETENWLAQDPDRCQQILSRYDFIRWDFRPDPSMDDIWYGLHAYHEVEGQWPELIVVDIASDVGHDVGEEWSSLRDLMQQSKIIARETGAHVLVLHHASDSPSTKKPCPRRSDMSGKLAARPAMVISCGMTDTQELHVAVVKNRHGRADKNADNHFRMALDADRSIVGDHVQIPYSLQRSSWGEPQHEYAQEGW